MQQAVGQIAYIGISEFLYYIAYGLRLAIATAVGSVWLFAVSGIGIAIRKRRYTWNQNN